MFSTHLASLTLFWLCFVCVYFEHIFFSQKLVLINLIAIFADKVGCNFIFYNYYSVGKCGL